jgi:SAM-dependent methyltransferase
VSQSKVNSFEQSDHSSKVPQAEFDAYAQGYTAGMDNSLKALLGENAEQYVKLKLRWLLRHFPFLLTRNTRILDYGCGTATLLRLMAEAGVLAALSGCDISSGMLEEAVRRWDEHASGAKPTLRLQTGVRVAFPDGDFDLVVISAVLHHVPPEQRVQVYEELCRVTRPGGKIVVFEHNPLNPVTRYVVAHTLIDQGALLLRAREVMRGLNTAGATNLRTRYIMFTPPRLAMQSVEDVFGWLPLGAQYVVTANAGSVGASQRHRSTA